MKKKSGKGRRETVASAATGAPVGNPHRDTSIGKKVDTLSRISGSWLFAGLAFSFYLALFLSPLLLKHVEPRWDARDQFYPAFTYFADSISEGRLPLWDPYTNCGYPFHAEPHNVTLNPVAMILGGAVADTWTGFIAFWTIHWWWAGIGMLFLAWHMGSSPAGGLLSASAFSLSGFFLGHAEHTSYITVASWLPWVIGLGDRAVTTSNPGMALLAGAALGLSSLGGYPILVAFTGFALFLWLALRFLVDRKPVGADCRPRKTRAYWVAVTLLIVAVVSIAIWSPLLNAFLTEGGSYSERGTPFSPEKANFEHPFSLPAMFSIFFPYATILGREWMGGTDISMANGYAGVAVVPLAAFWWFHGSGKRRPWWIFVFFLFMFLLSLGGMAGLRTIMYYAFPPLRYMRFSSPFRLYWILSLALAAGLGFSELLKKPELRGKALKIFLAWAGIGVIVAIGLNAFLDSHDISAVTRFPMLFLPAVVLAVAVFCVARWPGDPSSRTFHRVPYLFLALILIDMGTHLMTNSETAWIRRDSIRWAEDRHNRTTSVPGEPGGRLPPSYFQYFNAQLVMKIPIAMGYVGLLRQGFDGVLCKSRFVEILQSPRRFWISPGVEPVPTDNAALAVLADTGLGSPVPVFVEGHSGPMSAARTVPGTYGATRIVSYAPEKIDMEIDVPGPKGGFMASTERFAAGWKAWIDGKPVKVLKTNLYFRGIPVPPGRHVVVWKYEPHLWIPLVLLSYSTLFAAAGTGSFLLIRRARKKA